MAERQRKAVALISGGLDSMLAARIIQEQGIYVEGLNFFTGFCVEGHTQAIRSRDRRKPKRNNALWVAEQLGIKLHFIDVVEEYKEIVINPKYGYGANLNPCLDCKIFMVKKAYEWMKAHRFDFIITGEVVGQRPKSQRPDTMPLVAKESGVGDLLLRPLCAKRLPPTKPEREGWVDREKLYDFHGRSRKPQMELAKRFGLQFAQPAGGCCFLTDENYAKRLADLWEARGEKRYQLDDIVLLKVGRHLRPRPHLKLIIARDEGEGQFLKGYRYRFPHLFPISHGGPIALIDGSPSEEDWELAGRILARYSEGRSGETVTLEAVDREGNRRRLTVKPFKPHEIPDRWLV